MRHNGKGKPLAGTRGGRDAAAGTNLPLLLDYSTNDANVKMNLTIRQTLRLRDALIALERRVAEARAAFESDIAEVLRNGGGG